MTVVLEAQHACAPMPRGISYYTLQLISQILKRRKYEYELTFFDGNRERDNWRLIDKHFGMYNVPVRECNSMDYRKMQSSNDVFKEKSYNDYTGTYGDIFHFFHLSSIPVSLKGKMIVTIHDMLPMMFPEFFSDVCKHDFKLGIERLNKLQPIVIADSQATKKAILQYTNTLEKNIHVVYAAYDIDNCFTRNNPDVLERLGINFPYLLYLGGIDRRKNIIRIVEAFESIAEKFSDIKLVLAGDPDQNASSVISRINNSKYISRIIMLGYVTDEQKYALYSGAIAFLFPSIYEGFGLPVLEAMACGCPVISSNVSSLPEVAGNAAILVDPYNAEQLACEMERVVNSATLRKELSQKGLVRSQEFSWDKAAEQIEAVYKMAYEV